MHYFSKKNIIILISIAIFISISGYVYSQSEELINGPQIEISSPVDGTLLYKNPVYIEGVVKNVAHISLDSRAIFVDKKGAFKEPLLLQEGYNIIEIKAEDKFGRKIKKVLKLTLTEENNNN